MALMAALVFLSPSNPSATSFAIPRIPLRETRDSVEVREVLQVKSEFAHNLRQGKGISRNMSSGALI